MPTAPKAAPITKPTARIYHVFGKQEVFETAHIYSALAKLTLYIRSAI